jgi:hypothetical protein
MFCQFRELPRASPPLMEVSPGSLYDADFSEIIREDACIIEYCLKKRTAGNTLVLRSEEAGDAFGRSKVPEVIRDPLRAIKRLFSLGIDHWYVRATPQAPAPLHPNNSRQISSIVLKKN